MKGYKRERSPGKWQLRVYVGLDGAGKKRYATKTVEGGERAAQRALAAFVTEVTAKSWVDPAKLTVAAYLERWLTDGAGRTCRGKTLQEYRQCVERRIVPKLGALKLGDLSPLTLVHFYQETEKRGGVNGAPLSPVTVANMHRVLRRALAQAVQWGLLAANPCDRVDPPKARSKKGVALTVEETVTLLSALEETDVWLPALFAVMTGLRRGEILGLKWSDLDLTAGEARVERTLSQVGNEVVWEEPKSEKSRRPVALPAQLVQALVKHRGEQAQHRLLVGRAYKDQGLVFAREDGSPWRPDRFTSHWCKVLRRTPGVPLIRFHDLRHSHASQLWEAGVPLELISERLGHSGIGITQAIYAHMIGDMKRRTSDVTETLYRKALGGGG